MITKTNQKPEETTWYIYDKIDRSWVHLRNGEVWLGTKGFATEFNGKDARWALQELERQGLEGEAFPSSDSRCEDCGKLNDTREFCGWRN